MCTRDTSASPARNDLVVTHRRFGTVCMRMLDIRATVCRFYVSARKGIGTS